MTDAFGAFAVGQVAMQADAFAFRKIALFEFELRCEIKQSHFALLFGENFVEEREMVAEEDDRTRIIHRRVASDELIKKDRRHGSDVLMAEAQVRACEAGVAGLNG